MIVRTIIPQPQAKLISVQHHDTQNDAEHNLGLC